VPGHPIGRDTSRAEADGTLPAALASGRRSARSTIPLENPTMSDRLPRRRVAAAFLPAALALVLVACGGATASPPASQAPSASSAPSASAPAPSADPGAAIDVDALLADAAAKDGQTVRVTGNFLADAGSAQLCAVLMESYPPQCGGGLRLTGTVPADTLAALTTTTEPDLKKMWWGYVTATGTFHASGDDGGPSLEIVDIQLVEG
jgi:hypothetical protein